MKIKQKGYVIISKRGLSRGLENKRVFLGITDNGAIGEYLEPVTPTFIENTTLLERKLRIAKRWYRYLKVVPVKLIISL